MQGLYQACHISDIIIVHIKLGQMVTVVYMPQLL